MGEAIRKHLPCHNPSCGSSDALAVYDDGSAFCFSCNKSWSTKQMEGIEPDEQATVHPVAKSLDDSEYQAARVEAISDRGITGDTCRKFGVRVGAGRHYYPVFEEETGSRKLIGVKTRIIAEKNFYVTGTMNGSMLFGQQITAYGKAVTITEGELDAMAVYQMMGSKYSVVSVKNGAATALKECTAAYEYLNSFQEIVVAFDNDEPGRKAALAVAKLFPAKAKILKLSEYKDPCDYLMNNKKLEFVREWWRAPVYTADGVLFGAALMREAEKPTIPGRDLLWPSLTNITRGVRLHELWTFGAGSGVGKSEWFKEIAFGLIKDGHRVGMFMLEEPVSRTVQCMLGKNMDKRIYLDDVTCTKEEYEQAKQDVVGSDNLIIYDHKGMSDFENIRDKITYFVTALGVQYIFLDHITAMAEGKSDVEGNVNSRCHYIMEELNRLVQAHDCTIFLISHLRKASGTPAEEGGRVHLDDLYGSGAIKQRSHFVFAIEGDTQSADETIRNARILRCLKDRNTGLGTGQTRHFQYDQDTGRIKEGDFTNGQDNEDNGFL